LCFQRLEERLKSRFTDHRWLSRLLKNSLSGVHRRDAEDAEETPRVKTKKLPSGFLRDSAVRKHSFIIPLVIASHNEPMSQWPGDPSSQGLSAKATTFSPQMVYNLPLSLDQRGSPGPGPAFPSESRRFHPEVESVENRDPASFCGFGGLRRVVPQGRGLPRP
jgi:hypothetical protein